MVLPSKLLQRIGRKKAEALGTDNLLSAENGLIKTINSSKVIKLLQRNPQVSKQQSKFLKNSFRDYLDE